VLINATPHPIHIYSQDTPRQGATPEQLAAGMLAAIPAAEKPARLGMIELGTWHYEDVWVDDERCVGVGIEAVEYSHVNDLPEPTPGVRYIVSLPVALACAGHREDLVSPYLDIRDVDGRVIGCQMLARPV
jgi:hypothetical protein